MSIHCSFYKAVYTITYTYNSLQCPFIVLFTKLFESRTITRELLTKNSVIIWAKAPVILTRVVRRSFDNKCCVIIWESF